MNVVGVTLLYKLITFIAPIEPGYEPLGDQGGRVFNFPLSRGISFAWGVFVFS